MWINTKYMDFFFHIWKSQVPNRASCRIKPPVGHGMPRGLPDFVQPAVEPMVYGAMTQAGAKGG